MPSMSGFLRNPRFFAFLAAAIALLRETSASDPANPRVPLDLIALHHTDAGVIVEFDLKGTHDGPLSGIPPTGRSFSCRTASSRSAARRSALSAA